MVGRKFQYSANALPPTLADALSAQQTLKRVKVNETGGLSPRQAEDLLGFIAYRTRLATIPNAMAQTLESVQKYFSSTAPLQHCAFGMSAAGFQLELVGLEPEYHQIADIARDSQARHGFNTVTLPVQVNGRTVPKRYLVDTTFSQFISCNPGHLGWGDHLRKTSQGAVLLQQLLDRGFVELTPENAQLYVDGQRPIHAPSDARHLMRRFSASTTCNDYTLPEMVELRRDIRSPELIAAGAPLNEIVQVHPEGELAGFAKGSATPVAAPGCDAALGACTLSPTAVINTIRPQTPARLQPPLPGVGADVIKL